MHNIQQKILKLMDQVDVSGLSLREIAGRIEESGSPQKIKHHLNQLAQKGLIVIDRDKNTITKVRAGADKNSNLISLPIYGRANCGEATFFATDHVEGYLKVSKNILGSLLNKLQDLFVLIAVGPSMNRARIADNTIEDGDYVIVDKSQKELCSGEYVVSIIDGVANIKKIYLDNQNQQVVLTSESAQEFSPIYIHQSDLDSYAIAGRVVKVMKRPDEFADWREASAQDILKELGPISREDYDYYEKIINR